MVETCCPADQSSLTRDTSVEECKRLLQLPPSKMWPDHWVGFPNIAEAFRQLLREKSAAVPAPPKWTHDRGIVICGGGWRFFPSVYVTVRMIRRTGCTLPIQVWYLGDRGEFDMRMKWICDPYGVGWICANSFVREKGIPARILGGWEMKPLAAAYAPYKEVLFLDADSYPAYNPEEFLNHPEFRRVGAAFFPDQGGTHAGKLEPGQWERFGVEYHDDPGWESGQFAVDKSRHWKPLWLTWWMNQYSDYVYKHMYGDKDTFHICWRLCRHEVCIPQRSPGWHVVAFLQRDFAGRTLFIHRTRDKFRLLGKLDGQDINNNYMTRQKDPGVQFIGNLPHEQFGHDCLRECDEHLRPENYFRFIDGKAGWCRRVWHEIYTLNEYRAPMQLPANAVVVDIGAHVGSYTRLALRRGAGHVFAVEPVDLNLACLEHNVKDLAERVTIIPKAVWGGEKRETAKVGRSRTDAPGNTSTASVHSEHDTLEVPVIDIDELIEQAANSAPSGRVHTLKIDAEGSEYPALLNATRLDLVDNLVGEAHGGKQLPDNGAAKIAGLLEHLKGLGFTIEQRKNGPCTALFWGKRS